MKKKLTVLVAALILLAACSDVLYPIQYEEARRLCTPNGGLLYITSTEDWTAGGDSVYRVNMRCVNGAEFKHAFRGPKP